MKVLLCGVPEAKEVLTDTFIDAGFKFIDPICSDVIDSMSHMEQLKAVNNVEEKEWNDKDKFVTTLSAIDVITNLILCGKEFDQNKLLEHYEEAGKHLDSYDILIYCPPAEYATLEAYTKAIRYSYILIGWTKTNIKPTGKFISISGSEDARKRSLKRILESPVT